MEVYHGINGVVADSSVICQDCAFSQYGTMENLRRVARYIKHYSDYDLPWGLKRYNYSGEKENRTLKDAFEYGLWHGLMLDREGNEISYIDDYNHVWEDYYRATCDSCNKELDTVVLHADKPWDVGLEACNCGDCARKAVGA